ncbi:MAG: GNAT family N-acetyltransferase [Promethearchaeota archaeon]
MRIKDISLKDLDLIFKLEQEIFKENAFTRNLIKKLIKENEIFLKLEKRGIVKELIGYVIVVKKDKETANIINFLINPKYQNKGYGSFLLQETIKKVKNHEEIKKIILNVKINSIAIKLYKKFKFQIIQKLINYYPLGENAYLMELNI